MERPGQEIKLKIKDRQTQNHKYSMILLTGQPKIVRLLEAESSNSGWKEGRGWREGEREWSINQGVQIFRYEKRISLRELPCSIMPAVNNTVLYPKNYLRG